MVGDGRCAVVDTWWQTETGGILITPLPGATPTKPGSATLPFFGIEPVLVDDQGEELQGNGISGNLCLRRSWPGQARTIWGDHARFRETYFTRYPGLYFTGDGCRRDEDGYYWITGRVDDVLNVSGHRLGTAEVESALVAHAAVAEAAVVGFPHDIKGTGIFAYVIITPEFESVRCRGAGRDARSSRCARRSARSPPPTASSSRPACRRRAPARSCAASCARSPPATPSDLGDISTLADPAVVEKLVEAAAG